MGTTKAPASNRGVNLKTHIIKFHEENIIAVRGENFMVKWSNYFERKHLSLEKNQPLSFIDQLVAEKICKLNCDFEVTDEKFSSAFKKSC